MRVFYRGIIAGSCILVSLAFADSDSGAPPISQQVNTSETTVLVQRPRTDVAALRAKALMLRDEAERNPNSKTGRDAAIEEVEVLVRLAHANEPAFSARRKELVQRLKNDEAIPVGTRFRLVGLSHNTEVSTNRLLKRSERMAAYADAAWNLISDFPGEIEGYASLLRIARDSDDHHAGEIAADLILSSAPVAIKQEAAKIIERQKLIGKSLHALIGERITLPERGEICITTWSAKHPLKLDPLTRLARRLPEGTLIVALCTDGDTEAARRIASENTAPMIRLILPEGGVDSDEFQILQLPRTALYLTDTYGRIKTVSGFAEVADRRVVVEKGGRP